MMACDKKVFLPILESRVGSASHQLINRCGIIFLFQIPVHRITLTLTNYFVHSLGVCLWHCGLECPWLIKRKKKKAVRHTVTVFMFSLSLSNTKASFRCTGCPLALFLKSLSKWLILWYAHKDGSNRNYRFRKRSFLFGNESRSPGWILSCQDIMLAVNICICIHRKRWRGHYKLTRLTNGLR